MPVPFDGIHNYRLLIHKLEASSLLRLHPHTVYEILEQKLLDSDEASGHSLNILNRIFEKSRDSFKALLDEPKNSLTVFLPTDSAFGNLRQDQIDSLISDSVCGQSFLSQFFVQDEMCPGKVYMYEADYSSPQQTANLITIDEEEHKHVYFNGQRVSHAQPVPSGSNGMFYYLDTVKVNHLADFLYEMVAYLKRKSNFFNQLDSDWSQLVQTHGTDSTLFLPILSEKDLIKQNRTMTKPQRKYEIQDFLIKKHLTYYKLRDGQLLTSLSGAKYLINTFPVVGDVPVFLNWVPMRNFLPKSINCQQLEFNDLKGCSAQIIFFHSTNMPVLNEETVLDYIGHDAELSAFNALLHKCGTQCMDIYTRLGNWKYSNKQGFTIFLPTNEYFRGDQTNNSTTLLQSQIESHIVHGTFCMFYITNNHFEMRNMLGGTFLSKEIVNNITSYESYMSSTGIVVHKTSRFF